MNEIQSLKQQVAELTSRLNLLDSPSSLPLNIQKTLEGRGFLTFDNFITVGYGAFNVAGEFRAIIPNATANSIVVVTPLEIPTVPISAVIIASTTYPNQYEIYVQGTATQEFSFVVFLTKYLQIPR